MRASLLICLFNRILLGWVILNKIYKKNGLIITIIHVWFLYAAFLLDDVLV